MRKAIVFKRAVAMALSIVMLFSIMGMGVDNSECGIRNAELEEPVTRAHEPQSPADSNITYHSVFSEEPLCPNIEQYGYCYDIECEHCDNGEL